MCQTTTRLNPEQEARAKATLLQLELEEKADRKRRPSDSTYRTAMRRQRKRVGALVDELANGKIGVEDFARRFRAQTIEAHTVSGVLGRQRAGDLRERNELDGMFGASRASRDDRFREAFMDDLRGDKYRTGEEGAIDAAKVKRRALMYVDKARATANEAFVLASPGGKWERLMLAGENCGTCPGKAKTYDSYRELLKAGLPADGSDECVTNCNCVVVSPAGVIGFSRVFD